MVTAEKKWALLSSESAYDGEPLLNRHFALILDADTVDFKKLKSAKFFSSLTRCTLCIVCNGTSGAEDEIDEYIMKSTSSGEGLFFPTMSEDDLSEVQSVDNSWHQADVVVVFSKSTDFFEKASSSTE